ncbi:hypothetical protein NEPAR04_1773 [Nematocida parisii]|nr:hypothetical protein NEPAR08_1864 [Nematocida parisii]KAI5131194.1 hypothetical protein NEPAR03_2329 [Nematocida parisii]KAI5143108.1 hypothetical protein NEPAR04_1773 [Nematocida parisii]
MEGYIDEEILRIELQKEISEKEGEIEEKDIDKIYKIVMDINKRTPIFKDLPESLTNFAYNIFYIKINSRIFGCVYKEDTAISAIKDSIAQTSEIIDMIEEGANKLDNQSKKEAFYKLISNNHMIMAQLYMNRKNFYDSSINILREKAGRSELGEEIASADAMVKLCELTKSKKCSRLQRVLDILMKDGNKLTITDNSGKEQSNADKLRISNDDIYSLQLLARTEESDFLFFTCYIINGLIYNLIWVQEKSKKLSAPIVWLYYTIYEMSIKDDEFNLGKDENKDRIKTCVDQLNNMENIRVIYNKYILTILDRRRAILEHKDFDVVKVRNNVLPGYLKLIISDVYGIIYTPDPTNNGLRTTTIIIAAIIMIVIMIVFSIIFLYPNEANKIMNNLNIM